MTLKLSSHALARAVLLAAATLPGLSAAADDPQKSHKGKEKCYGVAKAGENGCHARSGSHTCGGCSTADFRGEDWKWVPSGTCLTLGGQLQPFDGVGKLAASTPMPDSAARKTAKP